MSDGWKKERTEHYKISSLPKCPECGEAMLPVGTYTGFCEKCKTFQACAKPIIPARVEGGGDA